MQNTDEKTKRSVKKTLICTLTVLLAAAVLVISLGVPGWDKIFVLCGIYADLGDGISLSFVSVGSADACFIKCGDKNVLIDTGTSLSYSKLSSYLKRTGCTHFDAIVLSHPDSDHIGGAVDVMREFGTDALYMYPVSEDLKPRSDEYLNFENYLKEYKVNVVTPDVPSEVKIGEMTFCFISPLKNYNNTNDFSLAVKIKYRDKSFLFTGDMSEKAERDMLNSNIELKSDVLKVAHHGSSTSSCEEFIRAVSPEIAVVSVDSDSSYLPDYGTMALLNKLTGSLYRTDTDKTVVVTYDDNGLRVKTHA